MNQRNLLHFAFFCFGKRFLKKNKIMDMGDDLTSLSDYNLAVDENGIPLTQNDHFLLVNSSGEYFAVKDSQQIRENYGIMYSQAPTIQIEPPPVPSTSSKLCSLTSPHQQSPQEEIKRPDMSTSSPIPSSQTLRPSTSSQQTIVDQTKKKGLSRWTHAATLLLIEQWCQRRERFANNTERNEVLWEEISASMRGSGYDFSSHQVENKFKYLKKSYTECVDYNRRSTGVPEKYCSYFEELHVIFGNSHQIRPPTLVASRRLHRQAVTSENTMPLPHLPEEQLEEAPVTGDPMASPSTQVLDGPRRRSRLERTVGRWAEEFRIEAQQREEARARRHEDLMNLLRESNAIYERLTERLIDKL